MEDEAPVIYGLEFQARSLCAQAAETDSIRFLVGTQSLRSENQVHYIDFDDENNIINKSVFLHREGEIWNISASTFDASLFATCFNKTSDTRSELRAALWRLPGDGGQDEPPGGGGEDGSSALPHLNLVCNLETPEQSDVKSVLWPPGGEGTTVLGLSEDKLLTWDLDRGTSRATPSGSTRVEGRGAPRLTAGAWNPHHTGQQVATANDTSVRGWDLRTMSPVYHMEGAHGQLVRGLDFNPNKQYQLASCGDDCRVKFWDTRNTSQPLKTLSEHSHWVWAVSYNGFHDQLVLTASSDSRVVLNSIVSLSSEPFGHLVDDDQDDDADASETTAEPPRDGVLSSYEEHEDSVYGVAWSAADPWTFASLSYDGRLVINRVPRAEKYRILL